MPQRSVDIHYRRLDRENGSFPDEVTLAESLRQALQAEVDGARLADDVTKRVQEQVPNRPGDIRCWNNYSARDGAVFGTLCLYRPTELQAVIASRGLDTHPASFPIAQIEEAEGRDFLRAIAYWMAIEDHFYLIQSPSLQTGPVENYLTWLLRKACRLTDEQWISLASKFDTDIVGGDLEDLTAINIGGSVDVPSEAQQNQEANEAPAELAHRPGAVDVAPGDEQIVRERLGRRPRWPDAWELLHRVFDERSIEALREEFERLRMADPNASLDVEMEFFVVSKKRSETGKEARQRALRALQHGLRDMPEGAVTARGKDGRIRGGEVWLKAPRKIELAPAPEGAPEGAQSSLLDLDDAFRQMQIVHQRYREDGRIG